MLHQGNAPISSSCDNDDYNVRSKRDIYNDLQYAIGLLKEFDEKINKLHPQVSWKLKLLIRD